MAPHWPLPCRPAPRPTGRSRWHSRLLGDQASRISQPPVRVHHGRHLIAVTGYSSGPGWRRQPGIGHHVTTGIVLAQVAKTTMTETCDETWTGILDRLDRRSRSDER